MFRKYRNAIFLPILITCINCDEKVFTANVDCDDCYVDKPVNADLVIELTISNQYPRVPVVVYNGDFEDDKVIEIDTVDYTPFYVWVPTGRKYSVKAEYKSGGKTVFAVNGTNLKVKSVSDACDEDCYVIENDHIDVRIRKEFP